MHGMGTTRTQHWQRAQRSVEVCLSLIMEARSHPAFCGQLGRLIASVVTYIGIMEHQMELVYREYTGITAKNMETTM